MQLWSPLRLAACVEHGARGLAWNVFVYLSLCFCICCAWQPVSNCLGMQESMFQNDPSSKTRFTKLIQPEKIPGCFVHVEGNMRLEASTWCNYGHPNSGGHLEEGHLHLEGHRHYIGANDSKNLHNSSTGH